MKKLGLILVCLMFLIVGCGQQGAINVAARTAGCVAITKAEVGELNPIVELMTVVIEGDSLKIGVMITKIAGLDSGNVSKIALLSLQDLLGDYDLSISSDDIVVSPEVIAAAKAFLQGVEVCKE